MAKNLTRREVLTLTALAPIPLSGCVPEGSAHADLGMEIINVSENNDGYDVVIEVEGSTQGNLGPFRNVSIVGYSGSESIVCRHVIGDIQTPNNIDKQHFNCQGFPHTLRFNLEQDPCSEQFSIYKRVYDNATGAWRETSNKCE